MIYGGGRRYAGVACSPVVTCEKKNAGSRERKSRVWRLRVWERTGSIGFVCVPYMVAHAAQIHVSCQRGIAYITCRDFRGEFPEKLRR